MPSSSVKISFSSTKWLMYVWPVSKSALISNVDCFGTFPFMAKLAMSPPDNSRLTPSMTVGAISCTRGSAVIKYGQLPSSSHTNFMTWSQNSCPSFRLGPYFFAYMSSALRTGPLPPPA